jgi:hypothetical protein
MRDCLQDFSHLRYRSRLAFIHFVDGLVHFYLLSGYCFVQIGYRLFLINFQSHKSRFHIRRLNARSKTRVLLLFVEISKRIRRVGAQLRCIRTLDHLTEISRQVPGLEHVGF